MNWLNATRDSTAQQASSGGSSQDQEQQQSNNVSQSDQTTGDVSQQAQEKAGSQNQVSVDSQSVQPSSSTQVSSNTTSSQAASPEPTNTNKLDEFWQNLDEEFKNKQKSGRATNLPWGDEFKEILTSERENQTDWKATKQEWKDCKVGAGEGTQKMDYCGYVEFEGGSDKYKIRVSYTWQPGQQKNKWDIIIVKKNGNQDRCYDKTTKDWRGPSLNWDMNFNGESGSNMNGWGNLGCTSISMEK